MKQVPHENKKTIWYIFLIGLIAVAFTGVWLGIYNWLTVIIWKNNFVSTHRFMLPIGVLIFSLLIGLCQKYLRAPNMIHGGGLVEAFSGGSGPVNLKTFPVAVIVSYLSLLSGASIGPEGSIGLLVTDIVTWFKKKFTTAETSFQRLLSVGLASAYNGIIGNPLFTAVLSTEVLSGNNMNTAVWNLLGGVIGFCFFTFLQLHVFAKYIPFAPINSLKLEYFGYAFLLAIIGVAIAIFTKVSFQFFEKMLDRFFKNSPLLRIMTAGVITAVVVYFFPEVMFAGETQIFPILANPAAYGILLLLLLAILKIVLMALSFKSGYIGGPSFPILFSCTMVGLALHLMFPSIPLSILIPCIEVSAFALALNAPLTAILLVALIVVNIRSVKRFLKSLSIAYLWVAIIALIASFLIPYVILPIFAITNLDPVIQLEFNRMINDLASYFFAATRLPAISILIGSLILYLLYRWSYVEKMQTNIDKALSKTSAKTAPRKKHATARAKPQVALHKSR